MKFCKILNFGFKGIINLEYKHEIDCTQNEVEFKIDEFNNSKLIHCIIIETPLPNKFDKFQIFNKINPQKDIDGLSPLNLACQITRFNQ